MDALAAMLERNRTWGQVYARGMLRSPWGFSFDREPLLCFHLVLHGACLLTLEDQPTRRLLQGDIVFVAPGRSHVLSDEAGSAPVRFASLLDTGVRECRLLEWPGDGSLTELICGACRLDLDLAAPLLAGLPPLLYVSASQARHRPGLRAAVAMLAAEVEMRDPGARTIADRLVEVMFVQVIRALIEEGECDMAVWHTPSRDAEVARVLDLIQRAPGERWTLARLGKEVGLSRSALVRRFTVAIGEPPVAYLTRLRMSLAARLLRTTELPLTAISQRVGYESVFAFSTAFKRAMGSAPSVYRRELCQKAGGTSPVRSTSAHPSHVVEPNPWKEQSQLP
jgi:AraC-like DNA-binding protein